MLIGIDCMRYRAISFVNFIGKIAGIVGVAVIICMKNGQARFKTK